MKKYYILPLALLFFACGAENTEDSATGQQPGEDQEKVSPEEAVEEIESTEVVPTYEPENKDGVWQIDDYAEMFVGSKIYNSAEDVPDDKRGSAQYYRQLDIKGGFAHVTGTYEGWNEYVLWRMKDGHDLLGTVSVGCGPVCTYDYVFYKCKNGEYEKASMAQLFPMAEMDDHAEVMHKKILDKFEYFDYPNDKTYIFIFPQKGTSMEVELMVGADEIQVPILRLSWDGGRFSIEKKYTEVLD